MKASSQLERRAYDKGMKAGIKKAIENMAAAMALVLADKFLFDERKLVEAIELFNETFTEINDGRITIFDVADTLNDEYGIHVEISKG